MNEQIVIIIIGAALALLQSLTVGLLYYIIGRIDTVYTRTARHAVVLENHECRVTRMEDKLDIRPRPTGEEVL
jgi:uncharacterized protein YabN with tetrapyrrole methylase and pyrophosphatase domain